MAPEALTPEPHVPGLPEGLIVLRYGVINHPEDMMLLCGGRLIKSMIQHSEGLIVRVAPGYRVQYIPADDKCVIRRDDVPRLITAKFLIVDPLQEAGIRRTLEDMGASIA